MAQAMAEDIRTLKSQLDKEREDRRKIEEEYSLKESRFRDLESTVEKVKEEKKNVYGQIINDDIKPWMSKFKERIKNDKELMSSFDTIDNTLKKGLDNAFMNDEEKSLFRFVESVASADKVTSSTLDGLLKTEQAWGVKYEELMKEKAILEEEKQKREKELEQASLEKEEVVEKLKKELEELRATVGRAQNNINNVDGHFVGEHVDTPSSVAPTPSAPVVAPTVTATASKNSGKFESIFDFRARNDWRSRFPDPGVSKYSTQFK